MTANSAALPATRIIGGEDQRDRGAEAAAVDLGDHRHRQRGDGFDPGAHRLTEGDAQRRIGPQLLELDDVGAGGEDARHVRSQDHGARIAHRSGGGGERLPRARGERVPGFGTCEGDSGDGPSRVRLIIAPLCPIGGALSPGMASACAEASAETTGGRPAQGV